MGAHFTATDGCCRLVRVMESTTSVEFATGDTQCVRLCERNQVL